MDDGRGHLIQNIYYMLAYAYQPLRRLRQDRIQQEPFENIHDLFAAILARGMASQLKQGLYREYISRRESRSSLRGRLDLPATISERRRRRLRVGCDYDELTEDNLHNRILKSTARLLLRQTTVKPEHKAELKTVLSYFSAIGTCPSLEDVPWSRLTFHRHNQGYEVLLNLCRMVVEGLLLSPRKGDCRLAVFLDEPRMHKLYEKFLLEYYRWEHPRLHTSASHVDWQVDDGVTSGLPPMCTDVTLTNGRQTLILDAKYYAHAMQRQERFDSSSVHSGNLYQMYTYVKNRDAARTGEVSGLLLYARTEKGENPDFDYLIAGNRISVKTLDLNVNWSDIRRQLDGFVSTLEENA